MKRVARTRLQVLLACCIRYFAVPRRGTGNYKNYLSAIILVDNIKNPCPTDEQRHMAKRPPEPWYRLPQEAVCSICGRRVPPSQRDEHHLVPKSKGGRVTAVLHRICHRQLHALFTETQLAEDYATIEALLADKDVRDFVSWVRTKPDGFYERTRTSKRKRT
jgi:hypothetical protein